MPPTGYRCACSRQRSSHSTMWCGSGAILVFMPGVGEIRRLLGEISRAGDASGIWALPLHGGLSPAEQTRVFKHPPAGSRKVVVSTNVAETSITIDDVTVVVDSGKVKETRYDAINKVRGFNGWGVVGGMLACFSYMLCCLFSRCPAWWKPGCRRHRQISGAVGPAVCDPVCAFACSRGTTWTSWTHTPSPRCTALPWTRCACK